MAASFTVHLHLARTQMRAADEPNSALNASENGTRRSCHALSPAAVPA